jgi:hypothetical protein
LIDYLLTFEGEPPRSELVSIINVAMKTSPASSQFVQSIIHSDKLLANWKRFDHIFQPVFVYVNEINDDSPDILERLFSFITKDLPQFFADNKREFEICVQSINLSHLFKTILKLLKDSQYEDQVIEDEFMGRWFSSLAHQFDIAALVFHFLQNNREHTDKYLALIGQSNKPTAYLAAHFASSCSITDDLTDHRIDWFFKHIRDKKWENYELANFIKGVADKLTIAASPVLLQHHKYWLRPWVFQIDASIRNAGLSFVRALFPQFPKFALSTAHGTYPIRPTDPAPDCPEPEKTRFHDLIRLLLGEYRLIASLAKKSSNRVYDNGMTILANVPTGTYFEILDWAVYHSHFESELSEFKEVFLILFEELSHLSKSMKVSMCDLLHFLVHYKPKFFNSESSLTKILSALSRLPAQENEYCELIFQDFLDFVKLYVSDFPFLIVNSKLMRLGISDYMRSQNRFSEQLSKILPTLVHDTGSFTLICDTLLKPDFFIKQYDLRNQHYLAVILSLLRQGYPAVDKFCKLGGHVVASVKKHFANLPRDFTEVIYDLNLLATFNAEILRAEKALLWRPMNKHKQFWADNKDFLETCYNLLLQSNLTCQFAQEIITFLQKVLTSQDCLLLIGLDMLHTSPEDFYIRLNKDIRHQFAEFTVAVIKAKRQFDIAIRDLKRLDQGEIWDVGTFQPYSELLVENRKVIQVAELVEVYDRLVKNSRDLSVLGVATHAKTLFGEDTALERGWFPACIKFAEEELAKVTHDIRAADAARINKRLDLVKLFIEGTPVKVTCEPVLESTIITLGESQEPEVKRLADTLRDLIDTR